MSDSRRMTDFRKMTEKLSPYQGEPDVGDSLGRLISATNTKGNFLPIVLGRDESGSPLVADLDDVSHLAVHRTSSCLIGRLIENIIYSLAMHRSPKRLRILAIEDSQVELELFSELPLLLPAEEDHEDLLKWLISLIEERQRFFGIFGVTSLVGYDNLRMSGRVLDQSEPSDLCPHHHLLVIIPELYRVMEPGRTSDFNRVLHASRACGIHLVVASIELKKLLGGDTMDLFPAKIHLNSNNDMGLNYQTWTTSKRGTLATASPESIRDLVSKLAHL